MNYIRSINGVLYKNIDRLIVEDKLNNKNIFLFGANLISEQCAHYLKNKGYIITGILDNNKQKIQMMHNKEIPLFCDEYELQSPDKIQINNKTVVLVGIHDFNSAVCQLSKSGLCENKQVYNLLDYSEILSEEKIKKEKMLTQQEIKKYQIELLQVVKDICNKNELHFYLCGGTLLGAIRHKGYIPWDDDIDIFMPSDDLVKFKKLTKGYRSYETLDLVDNEMPQFCTRFSNKKTILKEIHYPFIIESGISIDIFPLSGFPTNKHEQLEFKQEILKFREKHDEYFYKYSINYDKSNISWLKKEYNNIMTKYDFHKSEYVGYLMTGRFDKELLQKKDFKHTIYVQFENDEYPIFSGYKNYLKNMYGDYMEMPPEDKRVNKHEFMAWTCV